MSELSKKTIARNMEYQEILSRLRREYIGADYLEQILSTMNYIKTEMRNDIVPRALMKRFAERAKRFRLKTFEQKLKGFTLKDVSSRINRSIRVISDLESGKLKIVEKETFFFYLEALSILYDQSPLGFILGEDMIDTVIVKEKEGQEEEAWRELIIAMEFELSGRAEMYIDATLIKLYDGAQSSELDKYLLEEFNWAVSASRNWQNYAIRAIRSSQTMNVLLSEWETLEKQARGILAHNSSKSIREGTLGQMRNRWRDAFVKQEEFAGLLFKISQADDVTKRDVCGWIRVEHTLWGDKKC